jgi:copper transport protein
VSGVGLIRVERQESRQRPVAELLALTGALLAGGAALLVPGVAGHAAQTSPRGVSIALDWLHLTTGAV